jgi:Fur family ferric uptake transcriptional regulator
MNNGPTGSEPGTPLELGIARLRSAGKRITQPRIALIGLLLKQDKPLSMEEIHGKLGEGRSFDLVTVYRCLVAFEGLGLGSEGVQL